MTADERKDLLECLRAHIKHYDKGEFLLREQETVDCLGILMTGSVEASKLEISGKRLIISRLEQGDIFGDVLSLRSERHSPVTVTALENVAALLIPIVSLFSPCNKQCASHNKLIQNLLNSVSAKFFELYNRISCITRSTTREKIMFFLKSMSKTTCTGPQGCVFSIPYDRAALAEYLNVDRSALSRELSAMKRDGLLDYHKNNFRLL